jgi:hypothetical protein
MLLVNSIRSAAVVGCWLKYLSSGQNDDLEGFILNKTIVLSLGRLNIRHDKIKLNIVRGKLGFLCISIWCELCSHAQLKSTLSYSITPATNTTQLNLLQYNISASIGQQLGYRRYLELFRFPLSASELSAQPLQ